MHMIVSLQKDIQAGKMPLLVTAAGFLGIAIASLLLRMKDAAGALPFILFVGGHYLGAFTLGHEFDHRTWSLQLTQPSRRWQLWITKLALSFGILLLTYLLTVFIMELTQPGRPETRWFLGVIALAAFSGPPLFVQYTRSTLGAAAVSFLALILMITGSAMTLELLSPQFSPISGWGLERTMEISVCLYSVLALSLATWKWRYLELRDVVQHRPLTPRGLRFARFLRMSRATPLRNIWVRELLLQSRAIAFGIVFSIILWIDVQLLKSPMWAAYAAPMLPLLILLPSWVVPLFVGLSCGHDRFEGTQFLSTTQPCDLRKQLLIRLALALISVIAFGGLISFWGMSAAPFSFSQGGPALDRELIGWSALICFAAGWFSTTISKTSLGAAGNAASIIGTVLGGLIMVHHWAVPWLVVFSGLIHKPLHLLPEWGPASSYWNIGFLLNELHDRPTNHLWFTGSLLGFILAVLSWTAVQSRYDHTPKLKGIKHFGFMLAGLLLVQLAMGSRLCIQFLAN
ncbi:MAG: hypothetical protein JNN07_04500 [Verrucomicrobiales bacterium]|nr:hypothetical protein [Verrucomicrobiales bacterium]